MCVCVCVLSDAGQLWCDRVELGRMCMKRPCMDAHIMACAVCVFYDEYHCPVG